MRRSRLPAGVEVRQYARKDGSVSETFTVRVAEPDGRRTRRSFDSLDDALDFQARRRSAKRWRPEELRQEEGGRKTLEEFFTEWWTDHAVVELKRATLRCYRSMWDAHALSRLGPMRLGDIDARTVVRFRGELLAAGVGVHSVVKTMAMLQRVFGVAVEYGDVTHNPFKAVKKPSPGPSREVRPLTPLQVERVAADLESRGYAMSAVLVRVMAYTGLRPQEALGLHWYAVRHGVLLVEHANADGELEPLKNRKRARKRSRTVELLPSVRDELAAWRGRWRDRNDDAIVFAHGTAGGLWRNEHYKTWHRRIYVPSTENVGLSSKRPYDLRHTWASLMIAEQRLSIVELAEQLGDNTSTVLDTYVHVMHEWRGRRRIDIDAEIRRARRKAGCGSIGTAPAASHSEPTSAPA